MGRTMILPSPTSPVRAPVRIVSMVGCADAAIVLDGGTDGIRGVGEWLAGKRIHGRLSATNSGSAPPTATTKYCLPLNM